jgi:hypothetical protein
MAAEKTHFYGYKAWARIRKKCTLDPTSDLSSLHLNGYTMKISSFYIFGFTSMIAFAVPDTRRWTVGQTVKTQSGLIKGRAASNATHVSTYLGIPYAKPPIDDLRFAAPESYKGNATIDGTKFVCIDFTPC